MVRTHRLTPSRELPFARTRRLAGSGRLAWRRTCAALPVWMFAVAGCGPAPSRAVGDLEPSAPTSRPSGQALLHLEELAAENLDLGQATATATPLSSRGARRLETADELYRQQRHTEAGLELEQALRTDPDSFEVHLALGRVLWASGSAERCRTHLQRAAELRPDDLVLHYLRAQLAADDQDPAEAVRQLRIALRCGNADAAPDFRALTLHRLAELLEKEGYLTAALDAYLLFEEGAARLGSDQPVDAGLATLLKVTGGRAGRAKSDLYERLGRFDDAVQALEGALEGQEPDAATRRRLLQLLSHAGRHDQAIEQARKLVAADPSAIDLLLATYRQAGRPDAALDDLASIAADHADAPEYLLAYVAALQRLGRLDQAEQVLTSFVASHPDQMEVRWRLFDVLAARSAWREALSLTGEALVKDASLAPTARSKMLELPEDRAATLVALGEPLPEPGWVSCYLVGCAAVRLGQWDRAQDLLEKSHRIKPDFEPACVELATVYNDRYRWADTLELLAGLSESEVPSARVSWLLGQAYDGLDETEQAVRHYQAAVRLNPADSRPLVALAELHQRQGDALRAIQQYRAAVEVSPVDAESREQLCHLYTQSGDREAASAQIAELRRISASPNRVARCVARLQVDPQEPDFEQFRRTLTEAMDASEPDCRSLTYLGLSYLEDADYERAREVLDQAVQIDPRDNDAARLRAYAYQMTLDFEESARQLRELLRRHPRRAEWIQILVGALVNEQAWDDAAAVLREQLARDTLRADDRNRYRELLLEVLRRAKRFDEEIRTLQDWLADAPEDESLRASLVGAYLAADRPQEALAVVEPWSETDPANPELRQRLVGLLIETGQVDRGCQVVLDLLEDDPDNEALLFLLTTALAAADRYDDALELVSNGMADSRNAERYQELILNIYNQAGRYDDAAALLGEMLHHAELSGGDGPLLDELELRPLLVGSLIQADRINEAQSHLTRWIQRSPDVEERFEYLKLLAACHQERSQTDQALETLEQAYALLPLDAGINNDLGYTWADAGVRLEDAEKCLRYAVAQDPRQEAYLDSLGWVLYKRADFAGAIKWLSRAVGAGTGTDPVIRDHLGDAYWRADQADLAVENWRLARQYAEERLAEPGRVNRATYERVGEQAVDKLAAVEGNEQPQVAPLGGADAAGRGAEPGSPQPASDRAAPTS